MITENNLNPTAAKTIPLFSIEEAARYCEDKASVAPNDVLPVLGAVSDDCFAVRVPDERMAPDLKPNDTVVIDPECEPETGDFILATYRAENGELKAMIRTYIKVTVGTKPSFRLRANVLDEEAYTNDQPELRVVGVVVEYRHSY